MSCIFPTIHRIKNRLHHLLTWTCPSIPKKSPSHFPHRRHFSHGCARCGSPSVCVVWNVAVLFRPSFLLNGMFYLPRHTMRWRSIPEMLHLLLRSFPESATAESLNICTLPLTWKCLVFTRGVSPSTGCFANVSQRCANGHNSSRCELIKQDTPYWAFPGWDGPPCLK